MKNFYIHISSLIIVVLVFMSSCQHKPNTTIAQAGKSSVSCPLKPSDSAPLC